MKKKKNQRAFTMVELLGVIVILGILGTVGIAGIRGMIKSAHERYTIAQQKLFVQAGQTYFTDHKSTLPVRTFVQGTRVTLKKLQDENYIEQIVDYKKVPYDIENSYVTVTKMGAGIYAYEGKLVSADGEVSKWRENSDGVITVTYKISGSNFNSGCAMQYTNGQKQIDISITSKYDIAGYIVSIYKGSQKLNELEYKEVGEGKSLTTKIKISAEKYPDGIYKLQTKVYDIYNNQKNVQSGNLMIDTIAPTCGNVVSPANPNGDNGWYVSNIATEAKCSDNAGGSGCDKTYITTTGATRNVVNELRPNSNWTVGGDGGGEGASTLTYKVSDRAGNTKTCSTISVKKDATKPICSSSVTSGTLGKNSWYTSKTVDTKATCSDATSGCNKTWLTTTGAARRVSSQQLSSFTILSNEEGTSNLTYKVSDMAGNEKTCSVLTVNKDSVAPTCNPKASGTTGLNGWYKSPQVTTTPKCDDKTSGCDTAYITTTGATRNTSNEKRPNFDWTVGGDKGGEGTSTLYYKVYDKAGLSTNCAALTVKKDSVKPTCNLRITSGTIGKLDDASTGWYITQVDFKMDDPVENTSGLNSKGISTGSRSYNGKSTFTQSDTGSGAITVYGQVMDNAGNENQCDKTGIKVDTKNPTCSCSGCSTTWTKGYRTVSGACDDNGGSGCASKNKYPSQTFAPSTGSATKTGYLNSTYTIYDKAGRSTYCSGSNQPTLNIYVDNKPPTVPTLTIYEDAGFTYMSVYSSSSGGVLSNGWLGTDIDAYAVASGSRDAEVGGVYYQYSISTSGKSTKSGTSSSYTLSDDEEGTSSVKFRACDSLNNCSTYSSAQTVKIDHTSPVISSTAPFDKSVIDGHNNATRNVTCEDKNKINRFGYDPIRDAVGGTSQVDTSNTSCYSGKTKCTTKRTYLATGYKHTQYYCQDIAGNEDYAAIGDTKDEDLRNEICCICRNGKGKAVVFAKDHYEDDERLSCKAKACGGDSNCHLSCGVCGNGNYK